MRIQIKLAKVICTIVILFIFTDISAQYQVTKSALNIGNPGGLRSTSDYTATGETIIFQYNGSGTTNNNWSPPLTIPFDFYFNGSAVSKFCLSKNGLLTFDTTKANLSVAYNLSNDNSALPYSSLPNNTICYFWDSFGNPLGTDDDVYGQTLGTAPNRQYWIRNNSYRIGTTDYAFFALVLEETTNKIYVVDMNFKFGGNTTATVGIQTDSATAYQVTSGLASTAGSPNITMGSGNSYASNNEYYIFSPYIAIDAGIISVDTPSNPVNLGVSNIEVSLKNFGSNNLTSTTINWEVDGIAKPAFNWTGNLPMHSIASVGIGSHTFTYGPQIIKAWTSNPNLQSDGFVINDTNETTIYSCNPLNGTYTIGGTSPDFADFSTAVAYLNNCGINGPVVFNVATSIYNEQIKINSISGSSVTNTVTFQSVSGDSTDVTLQYPIVTNLDNYTLLLNDADHVIFKNMTIKRIGTNQNFGNVVVLENNADYNKFMNCRIIGYVYNSSSSPTVSLVYNNSNTSNCDYNEFHNNLMQNGSYGIYYNGIDNNNYESGTKIYNNVFTGQSFRSLNLSYQQAPEIVGNNFIDTTTSGGDRVFLSECVDGMKFTHNTISSVNNGFSIGLYLDECDGSFTNRTLISNNFISLDMVNYSDSRGIYSLFTDNIDFYNNSVSLDGTTYSSSICIFIDNSQSVNIVNNIFCNKIDGYSIHKSHSSTISYSDNNCLYTTGTYIANWNNSQTNLSALQTATNTNLNSVSVNPSFVSINDLHAQSTGINAMGQSLAVVNDDIDGQSRDITPDIGADEFVTTGLDAKILWCDPIMPSVVGIKTIKVIVSNTMTTSINSLNLSYTNGTTAVTQTFSGLNITQGEADTLSFSTTYNFTATCTLYAYINTVNNGSDLIQINNTTKQINIVPALSGIYTINNTLPTSGTNYNSFNSAVAAISAGGIVGNVTFNVSSGTYPEQITIGPILGTSPSNLVTFQSASGDSTDVTLVYSASLFANNFTVKLTDAKYICFKQLTIRNTGSSHKRIIYLEGDSDYNKFSGCYFKSDSVTSTSNYYSIAILSGGNVDNNVFEKNYFEYGSIGIHNSGGLNKNRFIGNKILNNVFKNQYSKAINTIYTENTVISGNVIETNSISFWKGIDANKCRNKTIITNNYISKSTAGGRGIEINHNYYTPFTDTALVANNIISFEPIGSNRGIFVLNNGMTKLYHNSVHMYGPSTTSSCLFIQPGGRTGNIIKNNILITENGYSISLNTSAQGYIESDYNILWRSSDSAVSCYRYTYGDINTLASWQSIINDASHSVSIDPKITSNTDLHLKKQSINNLGIPLAEVTVDFDGELRDTQNPDIGADEFSSLDHDLKITGIVTPHHGLCSNTSDLLKVILKNSGLNSETNVTLTATVTTPNGTIIIDTLIANISDTFNDTIVIGAINTSIIGNYVYTLSHNLSTDLDPSNDTLVAVRSSDDFYLGADTTICGNELLILDAGSGYTYQWSDNSTLQTLNIDSSSFAPGIQSIWVSIIDQNGCTSKDTMGITIFQSYAVNLGLDTNICGDAAITLDAGQGSTFLWSDNSNSQTITIDSNDYGLGTITISVLVTDNNGCSVKDSLELTFASGITVNLGTDTILCGNETLLLDAGSGSTFLWSDNSTLQTITIDSNYYGLGTETISVLVTDYYGCSAKDSLEVTIVSGITVNLGADTILCGIDTLLLDAGSGSTYLWSDNSTSQTIIVDSNYYGMGTHPITVTVTDIYGCSSKDTISISFHSALSLNLGSDTTICGNESIILDGGSGIGFSYQWSDNSTNPTLIVDSSAFGLGTKVIALTIFDSEGCQATDSVEVLLYAGFIINLGSDTSIKYSYESILLDAGSGFTSYTWDDNSTNQTRQITGSVEGIGIHKYFVDLSDINGCKASDTIIINVTDDTEINNLTNDNSIIIYPNPAYNKVKITINGIRGDFNLQIIDANGKLVVLKKQTDFSEGSTIDIDISNLSKGIYFVKLVNTDAVALKKLIVQ